MFCISYSNFYVTVKIFKTYAILGITHLYYDDELEKHF